MTLIFFFEFKSVKNAHRNHCTLLGILLCYWEKVTKFIK